MDTISANDLLVERKSPSGHVFRTLNTGLVEDMPRISDNFTNVVVYLFPTPEDALDGTSQAGGSGFLVRSRVAPDSERYIVFAVTNWHVIDRARSPVVRINRTDGTSDPFPLKRGDWVRHPTEDLAVAVLEGVSVETHLYGTVPESIFATPELIEEFDIGIGDDVFLVGRFVHSQGKERNNPAVRFGHVAKMPGDSIEYEGAEYYPYLIDVASIGGYSGSPVYVTLPPFRVAPAKGMSVQSYGPFFLGVNFGHIHVTENVLQVSVDDDERFVKVDDAYYQSNQGVMLVSPAWKLAELLHQSAFDHYREKIMEEEKKPIKEPKSGVSLDASADEKESFLADLRQVSKPPSETDESSE